jgi:hypothetical protein
VRKSGKHYCVICAGHVFAVGRNRGSVAGVP